MGVAWNAGALCNCNGGHKGLTGVFRQILRQSLLSFEAWLDLAIAPTPTDCSQPEWQISDSVALPQYVSGRQMSDRGGGGAMENWGMVIYHYRALLTNLRVQGKVPVLTAASTIAHEVAHQVRTLLS